MPRPFFVIVDTLTHVSVTSMPSFSLCQSVITKLPPRNGYSVFKIPSKTKHLDHEFLELLSSQEVQDYYEGIEKPIKPEDWYPPTRKLPAPDSLSDD